MNHFVFHSRDLQYVDPLIYKTINQLQEVVKQKKRLEQDPSHTPESRELAQDNLTLDGVTIEDLGLDFVLPGYPNIELKVGSYIQDLPRVESVTERLSPCCPGKGTFIHWFGLTMFYQGIKKKCSYSKSVSAEFWRVELKNTYATSIS